MSCEHCTQGNVLAGTPEGQIVAGGAYLHAAPATETEASKTAIVLLTDVFGLPLVNCKIIADRLSKETGYDVWVPDLFAGLPPMRVDELEPLMPQKPGDTINIVSKLRLFWIILTHIGGLVRNRPSVVDARVTDFVKAIKAEKGYEKIGAVGYCFGGAICVRLGSQDLFDTVVIAHPGGIKIDEIKAIKVPSAWACAEEDMTFSAALRQEAEAVFAARKDKPNYIDYQFEDYKGTVHGFAARPALDLPDSVAGYEGAFEQTVAWFKKQL